MNKNILLVEPDKGKFPPLGLMKISTHHKEIGDRVDIVTGMQESFKDRQWDRIYVSSLFTWNLPLSLECGKYYSKSVDNPHENLILGGIGATLLPQYIKDNLVCKVVTGLLTAGKIDIETPNIDTIIPDYSLTDDKDSYYLHSTRGCIRTCTFCSVPTLEGGLTSSNNFKDNILKTRTSGRI